MCDRVIVCMQSLAKAILMCSLAQQPADPTKAAIAGTHDSVDEILDPFIKRLGAAHSTCRHLRAEAAFALHGGGD